MRHTRRLLLSLLIILSGGEGLSFDSEIAAEVENTPTEFRAFTTNGLIYVAVGDSGLIQTSNDGIQWVIQPSGTTSNLKDIVFFNQHFVAIGENGLIMRSIDGTHWDRVPNPETSTLHGLSANQTLIVAVGEAGTILMSRDGWSWTKDQSLNSNVDLFDVTAMQPQLVAVGSWGTVYVSTNGLTWEYRESGTLQDLLQIESNDSAYVALGANGVIIHSTDGYKWGKYGFTIDRGLTEIALVDNLFYAISSPGEWSRKPSRFEEDDFSLSDEVTFSYTQKTPTVKYFVYSSVDGINWCSLPLKATQKNECGMLGSLLESSQVLEKRDNCVTKTVVKGYSTFYVPSDSAGCTETSPINFGEIRDDITGGEGLPSHIDIVQVVSGYTESLEGNWLSVCITVSDIGDLLTFGGIPACSGNEYSWRVYIDADDFSCTGYSNGNTIFGADYLIVIQPNNSFDDAVALPVSDNLEATVREWSPSLNNWIGLPETNATFDFNSSSNQLCMFLVSAFGSSTPLEMLINEDSRLMFLTYECGDPFYKFDYLCDNAALPDDDNFENNDTCLSARDITSQRNVPLHGLVQLDHDWYTFTVEPEDVKLNIDLNFLHADGDLDMGLFESCNSNNSLAVGRSGTDNEEILNFDLSAYDSHRFYLWVFGSNAQSATDICTGNTYTLEWSTEKQDLSNPTCTIQNSANQINAGNTILLSTIARASDGTTANLSYAWTFPNGSPRTSSSRSATIRFNTPGIYNVTLIVTDNRDTIRSCSSTRQITVLPEVEIIQPSSSPVVIHANESVFFEGQLVNGNQYANGITNYFWDFGDSSISTSTLLRPGAIVFQNEGTYTVGFRATHSPSEGSPSTSSTLTREIIVEGNSAPLAIIDVPSENTLQRHVNELVSFRGHGEISSNLNIKSYEWSLRRGSSSASVFSQLADAGSIQFGEVGTYTIEFRVTDSNDQISSPATRTVIIANQSPTVSIVHSGNQTIFQGQPITFTAQGTDPDGHSLFYTWDVDGGTISNSTADSVTVRFNQIRTYNISVIAEDGNGGIDGDSVAISIQENAAPTATHWLLVMASDTSSDPFAPYVADASGREHEFSVLSNPSNGSQTYGAGHFTYTPASGYWGLDEFGILATDLGGKSIGGVVRIVIFENANYKRLVKGAGSKGRLKRILEQIIGNSTLSFSSSRPDDFMQVLGSQIVRHPEYRGTGH